MSQYTKEIDYTRGLWENEIARGTLYEEVSVVTGRRGVQQRRKVDGLVILGEKSQIANRNEQPRTLDNEDIIVIQTKPERLGPYLFGQALLSPQLIRLSWRPRSLRSVLLCAAENPDLGDPLATVYTMTWDSSRQIRPSGESARDESSTAVIEPRVEVCIRPPTRRYLKPHGIRDGRAAAIARKRLDDGAVIAPAALPGGFSIDGILIPSWNSSASPTLDDVVGRNVISIHSSPAAVGMYIAGEAIVSKVLLEHLGAASVRAIIVCNHGDHAIEEALRPFTGIEVWPVLGSS
jgi:hypothetical protein